MNRPAADELVTSLIRLDLEALETEARRLMPPESYDYYAGGADDERTLQDNVASWDRLRLRPRVLRDVSRIDLRTTLLGTPVDMPIAVAPTAMQRLAHERGEAETARGAQAAGTLMILSTRASMPFTAIAEAAPDAPRWFQVYVMRDRGLTTDLVEQAVEHGYRALVLTADTPVIGVRRRDVRNAFRLPDGFLMPNPRRAAPSLEEAGLTGDEAFEQAADLTFETIEWLAQLSGLPVVVKGVLRADDAQACVQAGAAGIVVSNHGGRQLDGALAPADALVEVVDAVGSGAEVLVDGGVRRGSDVLKALALGARGVLLGRPVLWGLATGGAGGVEQVLRGLASELALAMALAGAPTVAHVTRDLIAGTA
jgi:4-hydroxymandelate oxidase